MTPGWAGPVWGEPSPATEAPAQVRARACAAAANYRADGGESSDFVVLAASVAGTAHRLVGRRCEDSYSWVKPGPGRLGLIVADGVSTAGRGGEGADLAVEAAARYLAACGGWGEPECLGAARRASDELVSVAGASGRGKAAELSTTFVVALVTAWTGGAGGAGRAGVVLGRVGDSTAFGLAGGVWQELFSSPDNDDLHHVATDVLPFSGTSESGETTVETATAYLPEGGAIVLLTDGIANPLRDGPTTVAPALAAVLRAGPSGKLSPLGLAAAADFSRRGCQDDRTIVVAWPRPPDGRASDG
jgi:hypothetical protein